MTKEEKLKLLEEDSEKSYLFISPKRISGGARLFCDNQSIELYESMDDNTKSFAEEHIVDLISAAKREEKEIQELIKFNLIFCGGIGDIPADLKSPLDLIIGCKDRIVAEFSFPKRVRYEDRFVGFAYKEKVVDYDHILINFGMLLEEFDKNDIQYEIDVFEHPGAPYGYYNDHETRLVISYNPVKEKEEPKTRKRTLKNSNN